MSRHNARFDYPKQDYHIVFQSSINENDYYGMDELERKKLKIIQAKHGCRHCFHTLPDNLTLDLHKFTWNDATNCFEIEPRKVRVRLNTLEEAIIEYFPEEKEYK
ncbi:MAG: hypothetical protein IPM71_06830 [Bacteroidota bacterium]|nr:MAG: hypothetical protein IPM71_06830 [Bacteroidota bacterium]